MVQPGARYKVLTMIPSSAAVSRDLKHQARRIAEEEDLETWKIFFQDELQNEVAEQKTGGASSSGGHEMLLPIQEGDLFASQESGTVEQPVSAGSAAPGVAAAPAAVSKRKRNPIRRQARS